MLMSYCTAANKNKYFFLSSVLFIWGNYLSRRVLRIHREPDPDRVSCYLRLLGHLVGRLTMRGSVHRPRSPRMCRCCLWCLPPPLCAPYRLLQKEWHQYRDMARPLQEWCENYNAVRKNNAHIYHNYSSSR